MIYIVEYFCKTTKKWEVHLKTKSKFLAEIIETDMKRFNKTRIRKEKGE